MNIRTKIHQKSTKNPSKINQKSMHGGTKIEAWGHQNRGPRAPKSSSGRMLGVLSARTRFGGRLVAKKWPTWPQLGSQDGSQILQESIKNRCKNRSKNRCLSRLIFDAIWMDFGKENGSKLAPRWCRKSNLSWKCRKARNAYKTNGFSMILWVRGLQVGSQNRSKID